jgi:phage N-6-adenine-methyltransferase
MRTETKEKLSDLWQTPVWFFDKLNKEFNFDIDLCASMHNKKTNIYCSDLLSEDGALWNQYTLLETAFMNPPYSTILPFVKKAWELSENMTVVCLLKVDTSTKWWSVFWDYQTQQPKAGCRLPRFEPKRIQFDPPSKIILEEYLECGSEKDKKLAKSLLEGKITSPAFPSAVVIFDRRHLNN